MQNNNYDCIIIGGGVAGMTAALYCLRQNRTVTIIEKDTIGGQISESPRVENFPTIETISGTELADRLFNQITNAGANFEFGNVVGLEKNGDEFIVKTEFGEFYSKTVILATGLVHRKLNIENEENLIGHGISFCALCDGAFYKGEEIALIGDGNTALIYALLLSGYAKKVYLITMFDRFFGDASWVSAVKEKDNIEIIHNATTTALIGKDELSGVEFTKSDGEKFTLNVKALFEAIGQIPKNDTFKHLAEVDEKGYFVRNEDLSTKTPGLFVAGDCTNKQVRQLTTAANDGAIAATSACNYLQLNFK